MTRAEEIAEAQERRAVLAEARAVEQHRAYLSELSLADLDRTQRFNAYLAELSDVRADRDRRYALCQAQAAAWQTFATNLDILSDKIMLSVMATRRLDDRLSSTASDATADATIVKCVRESVSIMDSVQAILTARDGVVPTPEGDPPAVIPPVGDQPPKVGGGIVGVSAALGEIHAFMDDVLPKPGGV